jgi:hypothetical protein
MVHFIDPVSMQFGGTNGGEGFELTMPKQWVARVMPLLSMSLAVISAAAAAGRLACFPIPDVAGQGLVDNARHFVDTHCPNSHLLM